MTNVSHKSHNTNPDQIVLMIPKKSPCSYYIQSSILHTNFPGIPVVLNPPEFHKQLLYR